MTENFLQFIWKHRLFSKANRYSTKGDKIEILNVGKQNYDAGPDFFDARIKVNDVLWAGNVEIHIKSSYWYKHGHDSDSAYDNVILHVVFEDDLEVITNNKRSIPCLKLDFHQDLLDNYNSLMASQKWIPCFDEIRNMEKFFIRNWMDRMLLERLERKSKEVYKILEQNKFSWEETFYQLLARYFGMKVNADPFQQLARSIPLKFLARQKNSLLQLEALLFGQAGLLCNDDCNDEYYQNLVSEYQFLSDKFKLTAMPGSRWKWLRLRPANFPTIRIAQFASLVYKSTSLFSKIKDATGYDDMYKLLECKASDYWINHYQFGVIAKSKQKQMGRTGIDGIIINTVVPILFLYGESIGSQETKNKACELLEKIYPERNSIINKWKECGVEIKSAYQSQALLQLKSNYCDKFKCLQCEFGNRIIRAVSVGSAN